MAVLCERFVDGISHQLLAAASFASVRQRGDHTTQGDDHW